MVLFCDDTQLVIGIALILEVRDRPLLPEANVTALLRLLQHAEHGVVGVAGTQREAKKHERVANLKEIQGQLFEDEAWTGTYVIPP